MSPSSPPDRQEAAQLRRPRTAAPITTNCSPLYLHALVPVDDEASKAYQAEEVCIPQPFGLLCATALPVASLPPLTLYLDKTRRQKEKLRVTHGQPLCCTQARACEGGGRALGEGCV